MENNLTFMLRRIARGYTLKMEWIVSCQSCPTLCNSIDYSPPGSFVHGILQARILEWVAIPFSRGSSWCRDQTQAPCIAVRFLTIWATSKPKNVLVAQSCPTLCDPMDCSPQCSFIHWILQARILEWVAIPFSRGSSWCRNQTQVSCIAGSFFCLNHKGPK